MIIKTSTLVYHCRNMEMTTSEIVALLSQNCSLSGNGRDDRIRNPYIRAHNLYFEPHYLSGDNSNNPTRPENARSHIPMRLIMITMARKVCHTCKSLLKTV